MSDKISVRELPKVLQEKAIKELNEDPKRVPEDIAYIKNWLQQQRYITARMDDQFILTFLRGCKFSLERTKEKLDMYYTMKSLMKEVYENRDPLLPEIQEILNLGTGVPLINEVVPGTPGVMLLRNGVFDPTKISQENLMKTHVMLMDIGLMEDDNSLISGIYIVQDMKGMTLNHITSMSPSLMKKGMTCFQKAYPNRIKGMFVINPSPVFDTLFKLASPFMTEKLRSRMRVFTDLEELYTVIPQSIFPEEYGGDGGKIADITSYWKQRVESYRDWYLDDEKYKTNESLRPGKPQTSESLFGVDGSFRQLTVD